MKSIKSMAFLAITLIISFNANAQSVKGAEVQVSGLTCSMCQLATQKALKTIDFISDIKPDLNKNIYVITFKKDKPINFDLIKKKVQDAGFSVSKLVATFNFNNLAVGNNAVFNYDGSIYHLINAAGKVLNGDVRLMLINSGFISSGAFKKYSAQIADPSYRTGINGKEKVLYVTLASD
jgi:copper chaperone CopZ